MGIFRSLLGARRNILAPKTAWKLSMNSLVNHSIRPDHLRQRCCMAHLFRPRFVRR
jgi:hypothetical protein